MAIDMIKIKNPLTPKYIKQKHFNEIKENVKKSGYYLEEESFYHPGYQQWFTTNNWVIGKKQYILMKKQLFTFRYDEGKLEIYEYKKQDYYNVIKAAKILLDGIEGLDCVIDNLYCCEVKKGE